MLVDSSIIIYKKLPTMIDQCDIENSITITFLAINLLLETRLEQFQSKDGGVVILSRDIYILIS